MKLFFAFAGIFLVGNLISTGMAIGQPLLATDRPPGLLTELVTGLPATFDGGRHPLLPDPTLESWSPPGQVMAGEFASFLTAKHLLEGFPFPPFTEADPASQPSYGVALQAIPLLNRLLAANDNGWVRLYRGLAHGAIRAFGPGLEDLDRAEAAFLVGDHPEALAVIAELRGLLRAWQAGKRVIALAPWGAPLEKGVVVYCPRLPGEEEEPLVALLQQLAREFGQGVHPTGKLLHCHLAWLPRLPRAEAKGLLAAWTARIGGEGSTTEKALFLPPLIEALTDLGEHPAAFSLWQQTVPTRQEERNHDILTVVQDHRLPDEEVMRRLQRLGVAKESLAALGRYRQALVELRRDLDHLGETLANRADFAPLVANPMTWLRSEDFPARAGAALQRLAETTRTGSMTTSIANYHRKLADLRGLKELPVAIRRQGEFLANWLPRGGAYVTALHPGVGKEEAEVDRVWFGLLGDLLYRLAARLPDDRLTAALPRLAGDTVWHRAVITLIHPVAGAKPPKDNITAWRQVAAGICSATAPDHWSCQLEQRLRDGKMVGAANSLVDQTTALVRSSPDAIEIDVILREIHGLARLLQDPTHLEQPAADAPFTALIAELAGASPEPLPDPEWFCRADTTTANPGDPLCRTVPVWRWLNGLVRGASRLLLPDEPNLIAMLDRILPDPATENSETIRPLTSQGQAWLLDLWGRLHRQSRQPTWGTLSPSNRQFLHGVSLGVGVALNNQRFLLADLLAMESLTGHPSLILDGYLIARETALNHFMAKLGLPLLNHGRIDRNKLEKRLRYPLSRSILYSLPLLYRGLGEEGSQGLLAKAVVDPFADNERWLAAMIALAFTMETKPEAIGYREGVVLLDKLPLERIALEFIWPLGRDFRDLLPQITPRIVAGRGETDHGVLGLEWRQGYWDPAWPGFPIPVGVIRIEPAPIVWKKPFFLLVKALKEERWLEVEVHARVLFNLVTREAVLDSGCRGDFPSGRLVEGWRNQAASLILDTKGIPASLTQLARDEMNRKQE